MTFPTFDEWFAQKHNGATFEEMYMHHGALFTESMRQLTRHTRDYVSEVAQRTAAPKTVTVIRPGFNFVADLPPGYDDGRAEIGTDQDDVIVMTHPDLPPMRFDLEAMTWKGLAL